VKVEEILYGIFDKTIYRTVGHPVAANTQMVLLPSVTTMQSVDTH
jgi:hypothetical protein